MSSIYVAYSVATVAVCVSLLLVWYSKQLIIRLQNILEDVAELEETGIAYTEHLKQVYELETFYGDPTLESLLKHAQHVDATFKSFHLFNSLPTEALAPRYEEEFKDDSN
tara:strand:- start:542 stop:871 length:330 start_codon:yes stop_codon:yes gene_type:complete